MVGEHVPVQIHRYRDAAQPTVLVSHHGGQGSKRLRKLLHVCPTCACIACFWCEPLQLMATGAHGSCGENALLPVVAERGRASVSVITHPLATVGACVLETPLSCPGVTLRPVQVRHFWIVHVCS